MAGRIEEEFGVSFPVGESICDVHRKDIKAGGRRHDVDGDSDSEAVVFPEDTGNVNDFVGKVIDKESASPMKFQITSPVRQLAPSTVRYLGKKYKPYGDYVSQLPYVWYYVGVKSSCPTQSKQIFLPQILLTQS